MNTGKYTIDRFEGERAVLLYRQDESIEVVKHKSELPVGISKGDILFIEFNEESNIVSAEILKDETEQARKMATDLINKLKNKN